MKTIKDALEELNNIDKNESLISEALESDDYESLSEVELSLSEFDRFMNGVIENAKK